MTEYQYLTPKQLTEMKGYPFSIGQIRHYLHFRHKNGLNKAVRKIGKRIVVRIDLFEDWIESQARKGGQA